MPSRPKDRTVESLKRIDRITRRLRGEGGCDWDRAQTPESLAPYLIEEVHEAVEALHLGRKEDLVDEIGDSLYLWIFFLGMLEEDGRVSIEDAARAIEEKLVRRHPHVFGTAPRPAAAEGGWERRKRDEAAPERDVIPGLPIGMPSLLKARRIQEKAAAFGFDWNGPTEVLPKIREEVVELEAEISRDPGSPEAGEELGDLLFAVVNLARHLGKDPEAALFAATEKFRKRFNAMARSIEAAGHRMGDTPLDVMERHWQSVKESPASGNPPEDRP